MVDLNGTIIIVLLGSIGIVVLFYTHIIETKNEIKQKRRQVSLFYFGDILFLSATRNCSVLQCVGDIYKHSTRIEVSLFLYKSISIIPVTNLIPR